MQQHYVGERGTFEFETRMRHKDGHSVWVLDTGKVFSWTGDGKPLLMYGTHQDVSARKQFEEQLKQLNSELEQRVERRTAALSESEARFRSVMQNSPIGMALVAPNGRCLEVNEAICQMVGSSPDELVGDPFRDMADPRDVEAHMNYTRQLLCGEIKSLQVEVRYRLKSGGSIWVLLNISLVRNTDGTPAYFISQIQDISARKQLEQAIELILTRLAGLEGQAYYQAVATQLARILDADIATISRLDVTRTDTLNTLGFVEDGSIVPNMNYKRIA